MMPFFPFAFVQTAKVQKVGELTVAFCHSLMESHYSQNAAAIDMYGNAKNAPTLSKSLNEFGLNLHRMLLLPVAFWRAFLPKLARIVGCEDLIGTAAAADLARDFAQLRGQVMEMQRIISELRQERRTA